MEEPGYTHPLGHTLSVDLGPHLNRRWRATSLRERRELLAELQSLYRSFDEHDLAPPAQPYTYSLLSPAPITIDAEPAATPEPEPDHSESRDLLSRLLRGQVVAEAKLRELMEAPPTPPPVSPDTASMEQEMRERLGPIIETLIEEHILGLKAELRFRLRAELESLISAEARKP